MTVAERYYDTAQAHLSAARDAMRALATTTGDTVSAVVIDGEFEQVAETCADFARHQLGLHIAGGDDD